MQIFHSFLDKNTTKRLNVRFFAEFEEFMELEELEELEEELEEPAMLLLCFAFSLSRIFT